MKCQNCGARLSDASKVCRNCGAQRDNETGYTLHTAYDRLDDFYSTDKKEKSRSGLYFIIALVIIALLAGIGSFIYSSYYYPKKNTAPELSFTTGSGIINGEEKVIYASIDDSANIQYIHGAWIYRSEPANNPETETGQQPISSEYEYTKNIDASVRTIYFYADDLELTEENGEYKCYLQMSFSFYGSKKHFFYTVPISFSDDISNDASDVIFDHSIYETKK